MSADETAVQLIASLELGGHVKTETLTQLRAALVTKAAWFDDLTEEIRRGLMAAAALARDALNVITDEGEGLREAFVTLGDKVGEALDVLPAVDAEISSLHTGQTTIQRPSRLQPRPAS